MILINIPNAHVLQMEVCGCVSHRGMQHSCFGERKHIKFRLRRLKTRGGESGGPSWPGGRLGRGDQRESTRLCWMLVAGHAVIIVSIVVEAIALNITRRGEERVVREGTPSRSALRKRSGESKRFEEAATEKAAPQTAFLNTQSCACCELMRRKMSQYDNEGRFRSTE